MGLEPVWPWQKPPLATRKDCKKVASPTAKGSTVKAEQWGEARSFPSLGRLCPGHPSNTEGSLQKRRVRGLPVTQARGLTILHPSSPQQDVLWPLPTTLGSPEVKSSQHPSGSKPRGTCLPGHAGCCGFFSPLLQNRDMEEKKINPPNIPGSWRAWCDVTLEMGAQNRAGTRPWGAQETNLPKPALCGLACANVWSPALIWGPQC